MIEINIVKHKDEIGQLIKLFRVSFGGEISEKLWEWKYINNPITSLSPEVIVASDGGRIVGARPFLPVELWVKNERILAAQHCDTMVHPEFRNQGLFNRMGEYSLQYLKEHNNCALSYGFPGPMSRAGFLKQGYRVVVPLEMMFRPINYRRIFSKKLKRDRLGRGLGYFFDKVIIKKKLPIMKADSIEIEIFDSYVQELEAIDSLRKTTAIEYVRREKNLRWRFDQHPEHKYRYITAKIEGTLCGYAVISVQEQGNGLNYGMIIDYLVKNEDLGYFGALIEKAMVEFTKTGCDLIMVWACSEPGFKEELRKRFGFSSTFSFPYNRFIGSGYFEALSLTDQAIRGINIYDKSNWRITNIYPDNT
jgi:GNAT superfamily N-acetyltransferase